MKVFGIIILSIAALAVLFIVVLPVMWTHVLMLVIHGANTHHVMVGPGFLLPVVSNPSISLVAALMTLVVLGWGIWKLRH